MKLQKLGGVDKTDVECLTMITLTISSVDLLKTVSPEADIKEHR